MIVVMVSILNHQTLLVLCAVMSSKIAPAVFYRQTQQLQIKSQFARLAQALTSPTTQRQMLANSVQSRQTANNAFLMHQEINNALNVLGVIILIVLPNSVNRAAPSCQAARHAFKELLIISYAKAVNTKWF